MKKSLNEGIDKFDLGTAPAALRRLCQSVASTSSFRNPCTTDQLTITT